MPRTRFAATGGSACERSLRSRRNSVNPSLRRLDRDRIQVGAIAVARPSLDDVFLQATGRRLEGQERQLEEPEAAR